MRVTSPLCSSFYRMAKYMVPQNGLSAHTIRFVPNFRELRLVWSAYRPMSEGVECFVEEYLPIIRENNPQIKYRLDRTYVQCDPWVMGLYEWNRVKKRRACWFHQGQVLAYVEQMAVGGDFRPGLKRGVTLRFPRGMQIWTTETRGHDVFEVYSKWKGDPVDPERITSMSHPNLVHVYQMPKKSQNMDEKVPTTISIKSLEAAPDPEGRTI